MVADAGNAADRLLLADVSALPGTADWRDMLDRAGLLAAADAGSGDSISLDFAGTAMVLQSGMALADAGPWPAMAARSHGIGDVSMAPPDRMATIALHLPRRNRSRSQHLREVQRLCAVAAMISELCGAQRLYWTPAGLWSPVSALTDAVAASEEQGLPPVLHLVAFLSDDGAVTTRGLAHFCDVELRLERDGALSHQEAVKRLARLAVHAMVVGPLQPGASVAGLEPGETLSIGRAESTGNGYILPVRMRRGR